MNGFGRYRPAASVGAVAIGAVASGRAMGPARYSFCRSIRTRQASLSLGRLRSAPASWSRVLVAVMVLGSFNRRRRSHRYSAGDVLLSRRNIAACGCDIAGGEGVVKEIGRAHV